MVLVDHTGWKLRLRQWTGTTEQLIKQLESTYDNAPNMFSIRIHHGGKFQRYPGRMYVSGRVDIFDMVDIDLFTVVALNMMVLKLGYTGESEPMFYNYLRPLTSLDEGLYALACEEDVRCLATLVRSFKLIEVYIEHGVTVLDFYLRAPRFRATLKDINDEPAGSIAANKTEKMLLLTWHESSDTTKEPVIDDVMRQLSFDETELDGEAGFTDVVGIETQSKLPVSEEPDVGPAQEPILAEVSTQEPIVVEVSTQEPIVAEVSTEAPIVGEGNGQEDESASTDGEFFYDDEGIDTAYETEYDVQSSEDAGTNDDDDADEDFYMDLPFDNIGITNLVSDDVLEGEDVDVINADGFDSDPGNDEERNYRKRRLAELRTKMEGVINASGQWKYSFYTGQKFNTPKEAKDRVYLHSIESRRNLKLYKNDSVRIRARCEGKVPVFTMSQGTGPTGLNRGMEAGPSGSSDPTTRSKKRRIQISMSKAFRANAKAEREIRGDHVLQYSMLRDYVVELQSTNPNTTVKIAVERNTDPSLPTRVFQRIYVCLGALKLGFRACKRDLLGLDGAFMKGPFLGQVLIAVRLDSNNGIYPLAYALVEAETYKDLLWRAASATNVRDFEKCMLELKTMNPKAHEWLNKIPAEHWARSHFSGRAKSDLLLNNICEVFNGKIVGGRDKPMITLLEYIREYCMKRIVNVQGVIDKCTGPLTPTATRIMKSIKKEAHLMKVQWNGANKYQLSGSLGDQCVVDVVSMTCSCRKWELTGIPCKHDVAACWNMALNDWAAPPLETWVGRPKKKRKRSKHEDEPFVKDGKLSRKGRTITCQSSGNTGHNKATCKGQGRKATTGGNNAEAGGSASRQAQQTEPAVGQDGSGGSGVARQDGREMGDGIPTQSSAAGGASEWSFL
ncbi:heat stress transcription factor B-4-like protein [Tanacetum coccineum]